MLSSKCKICRRQGEKLFLKGEKCLSPKCPVIRKPYPPGQKRKRRRSGNLSEYGKELKEKQKLKNLYGLREKQFRNYVKDVLQKRGKVEDAGTILIKKLESRFDNVIFRLGLASSRAQARQMVSHAYFLINGKPVNIASVQIKKGDKITIRPQKSKKTIFQNISIVLKKHQPPSWIRIEKDEKEFNAENFKGEIIGAPSFEEAGLPVEISSIFEYYSR